MQRRVTFIYLDTVQTRDIPFEADFFARVGLEFNGSRCTPGWYQDRSVLRVSVVRVKYTSAMSLCEHAGSVKGRGRPLNERLAQRNQWWLPHREIGDVDATAHPGSTFLAPRGAFRRHRGQFRCASRFTSSLVVHDRCSFRTRRVYASGGLMGARCLLLHALRGSFASVRWRSFAFLRFLRSHS
uniref:Uncharacterized protein n=1 Tax=Rhipicephalus appendiculatus TaxID=34631 RepID=A0A131YDW6_RHIAP